MAELENATGTPSLTKAEAEDLWGRTYKSVVKRRAALRKKGLLT